MKQEHINEIKAIIVLAAGMILLASLISFVPGDLPWYTSSPNIPAKNLIRISGAYLAGVLLFIFGRSAYALVVFLFFWSWNKFASRDIRFTWPKLISSVVLICIISALLSMIGNPEAVHRFELSGLVGVLLSNFLVKYLGEFGSYIMLLSVGMMALILTGEFLVTPIFMEFFEKIRLFFPDLKEKFGKEAKIKSPLIRPHINWGQPVMSKNNVAAKEAVLKNGKREETEKNGKKAPDEELKEKAKKPKIKIAEPVTQVQDFEEEEPAVIGTYTLPALDLLNDPPAISTNKLQSDLMSGARLLEQTLADFGVSARVADIERGPAITRYELEPAPGVKVQKFTTLQDDIALAMKAATVRVVAPIPGKNRVGIEVPNSASAMVYLKEVLMSQEFRSSNSKIMLALGKDTAGKPIVADLADMPHLLIAGTTGSGKTVCVNGLIMSLLMSAAPDEVKLVIVDPKMVEMAQYNDIPHLLCPTVTDTKRASAVLNWVVGEMENRYKKLSNAGTRNISSYNEKGHRMPYIIVLIDELADLMQVAAKGVESAITRLAQLSRAVGIHLILATQRPSVNVITGVIKANFPARISFKVASKVDSRTVLDMNGAETLLGKGDMLFLKPGDAKPIRGQSNLVSDEEIGRVISFIKNQQAPSYNEAILEQQKTGAIGSPQQQDEFYDEAVRLVIETNQASVSILQRRLRLGYTRAARLIDMMEQNGLVGPYVGSKPRDILVDREQWLLENMKKGQENKPNE
ncbi:MAG TPA: DNA translocase FtsK [Candidatus Omnitrophota bacterium]|nr:DNA translocase FtsK [Candidatus Omnitrophota bacterium]